MRFRIVVSAMVAMLIAGTAFAQRGAGGGIGSGGLGGGGGGGGAGSQQGGAANGGARGGNNLPGSNRQQFPPEIRALRDRMQTRAYEFEPTGEEIPYALFVPGKYKKTKPNALVIALHGAGVGPDSIVGNLANAADRAGYILVAPMGYNKTGWYGLPGATDAQTARYSEQDVMDVLELVRAEFNVDPRRIYIAGHSMGGIGAISIAAKHPGIFAAVGAMSPAINRATLQFPNINRFDAAPIVVLAGDNDDLVPVDLLRDWVNGLEERKVAAKYYEYKNGNHAVTLQQGGPKRVFDFFKKYSLPEAKAAP